MAYQKTSFAQRSRSALQRLCRAQQPRASAVSTDIVCRRLCSREAVGSLPQAELEMRETAIAIMTEEAVNMTAVQKLDRQLRYIQGSGQGSGDEPKSAAEVFETLYAAMDAGEDEEAVSSAKFDKVSSWGEYSDT